MTIEEFAPFRLVGGTSLSLRYGHRMSDDIDLFTDAEYGSEVKGKLQLIYNELGLKMTATATDLEKYVNCIQCKKNGSRTYKLLPD